MRLYLEILQRKGEKGVNDELVWLCVRGVCVCGGGGGGRATPHIQKAPSCLSFLLGIAGSLIQKL